jgi:acyl-CoA synthetase (AMP-forming)/AMP-acid ligase II
MRSEIDAYAARHLPAASRPRLIDFVQRITLSAAGKTTRGHGGG